MGYLVEFQNKEQEDNVTEFVKEQFDVGRFWIGAFDPSKPSKEAFTYYISMFSIFWTPT